MKTYWRAGFYNRIKPLYFFRGCLKVNVCRKENEVTSNTTLIGDANIIQTIHNAYTYSKNHSLVHVQAHCVQNIWWKSHTNNRNRSDGTNFLYCRLTTMTILSVFKKSINIKCCKQFVRCYIVSFRLLLLNGILVGALTTNGRFPSECQKGKLCSNAKHAVKRCSE